MHMFLCMNLRRTPLFRGDQGFFYQFISHLQTNCENIADFTKGFQLFTEDNPNGEASSFFHINSHGPA